jgi:hypothetical protein
MRNPNSKPRSAQRLAVLKLFEKQDVITKYDAAEAIGLSHQSAANLLSAMAQDGVIGRGADSILPAHMRLIPGKANNPLRTFVQARKSGGYNPFLIMQLRRRTNEQLGIEAGL